jgi:hypothetical protein
MGVKILHQGIQRPQTPQIVSNFFSAPASASSCPPPHGCALALRARQSNDFG